METTAGDILASDNVCIELKFAFQVMFDFLENRTVAEFSFYLKSVHYCNHLVLLLLKKEIVSYFISYIAAANYVGRPVWDSLCSENVCFSMSVLSGS